LFGGLLINRCVTYNPPDYALTKVYDKFQNEIYCDNSTNLCSPGQVCVNYKNPDFGVSSFDNFLKAVLSVFIIITMEGWTTLMYYIRRATGTYAYDIYFYLTVIIGTFFILNLMVAV
jgi:hypothetical protein